jgi:hypothetical protein
VESVISVGDEVPMGNFGPSSVPDAIYDSETDERSDSLLAIWARDQIQGPMFHSRGGESVLRSTLDLILFRSIRESVWKSQEEYVPGAFERRASG